MRSGDECALLERAKECDAAALGELYDRYASKIFAYILYRVGNEELAEDLTANVFIKMLNAVRSSKSWKHSFSGWLYRIAHNAVVDYFRRNDYEKSLPLDERLVAATDDPFSALEQTIAAESIGKALLHLTNEQQLVIVFKFFQGLSNLQTAEVMGKTEGAIKSLQYRALASLRRNLEADSRKADEKGSRDRA